MHPFSAIVTASGAITFTDTEGQSHTIVRENGRYDDAKALLAETNTALAAQDEEGASANIAELVKIANPIKALFADSDGKISVREGVVYYTDERGETELHNVVTERIIWMLSEGFDAKPMILFLGMLMENPSYRSVNDVYRFMEKNQMGITPDGFILAYKKVRRDYTDIHSGTFDNHPGQKPQMRRNEVEDNPNVTCSKGLHVCSYSYLPEFGSGGGGDRVVVCKVNPRDVVSVPVDYNDAKMRVCEYEVLYEVKGYTAKDVLASAPVSDESGSFHDEEDDDCPRCGSANYHNGYCGTCGYEDEPHDDEEEDTRRRALGDCPNCGATSGYYVVSGPGQKECKHCGYENYDEREAQEAEQAEEQPAIDLVKHEQPPVIEFFKDGKWTEFGGHCCNTREEAEHYVAALGDNVRIRPDEPQQEQQQEWPLAKPVDLRDAVAGVQEAATGLYGDGQKVDVNMALDGNGGLQVNITPKPVENDSQRIEVAARVKRIIVEHLGVDEAKVTDEAMMIADLGADSLDIVELVMALEEDFSIEVPDDECDAGPLFKTHGDHSYREIVDFVLTKLDHPLR